ncbi:MAG TPA: PAS domain-containing protein [Dongiaceae bacterium]|nr:PAS domain-containing protein [Dongiaceae bacterium]
MIEAPSVASLESASLQRLDDYWRAQRAGREMPRRADIDPIGLKPILPKVILARVDMPSQRIHYTVVGTHCVAMAGMDFTGCFLDELDLSGETDTNWPQLYQRLLHERAPIFGTCQVALVNGQRRPYVSGLYPLSDELGRISHIIELKDVTLEAGDRRRLQPAVPITLRKPQPDRALG